MSKRITATLAICVLASVTAGIALARPGNSQATQAGTSTQNESEPATQADETAEMSEMSEMTEQVGDSAYGDSAYGDSAYGDAAYGDSASGESAYGESTQAETASNDSSAADSDAPGDGIIIDSFQFTGNLTVSAGQTVTVTNADSSQHTLTSDDGLFDTGVLESGGGIGTFTAPTEPGTYTFFCAIHPSMTATITVVA